MALQVFFPRALHGRLEGQHQHLAPTHLLGELISGKGLAEPHFCVPEKVRRFDRVLLPEALEIGSRSFDRRFLLWPHPKIQRTVLFVHLSCSDGNDGCLDVFHRTLEPFATRMFDSGIVQGFVNLMIREYCPVVAHGGLFQNNAVRQRSGFQRGILLRNAHLSAYRGVTDLEQPSELGIRVLIGVDRRFRFRSRREELLTHCSSPSVAPWIR